MYSESIYWEVTGEELQLPIVNRAGFMNNKHGSNLGWHQHDGIELVFSLKGSKSRETEDGKIVKINSKNALIIQPKIKHRSTHNITLPGQIFWIILDFKSGCLELNTPFNKKDLSKIIDKLSDIKCKVFNNSELILDTLGYYKEAIYTLSKTDDLYYPYLRSFISQIILESFNILLFSKDGPKLEYINLLTEYIKKNYSNDISVNDLANMIGKKNTYVYELFKYELGHSPMMFIQRIRLEKAIKLLEETNDSITSISYKVGFSSSQYFSKVFFRNMNCSPSVYRNSFQNNIIQP